MKIRWHVLLSVFLTGAAYAIAISLGAYQVVAFGIAAFVFIFYWVLVMTGHGPDVDFSDFL